MDKKHKEILNSISDSPVDKDKRLSKQYETYVKLYRQEEQKAIKAGRSMAPMYDKIDWLVERNDMADMTTHSGDRIRDINRELIYRQKYSDTTSPREMKAARRLSDAFKRSGLDDLGIGESGSVQSAIDRFTSEHWRVIEEARRELQSQGIQGTFLKNYIGYLFFGSI